MPEGEGGGFVIQILNPRGSALCLCNATDAAMSPKFGLTAGIAKE